MRHFINIFACFCFVFLAAFVTLSFADEQITVTTYYPAPYGIYKEIRSDQMTVGSAYRNTALTDGTLLVFGQVGIGTATPQASLDVAGGIRLGWDTICNASKTGTIRYNSAIKGVEECDGSTWKTPAPAGLSDCQTSTSSFVTPGAVTVQCPAGYFATGGGMSIPGYGDNQATSSYGGPNPDQWTCSDNRTRDHGTIVCYARCCK